MGSKRVSSTDIAREVGVSQATVSYVLSGRWEENNISAQTRDKVEKTARKLGYYTNRMAQSLKLGRSMVVGAIAPSVTFSFFSEIVRGAEAELAEAGYILVLMHSHENPEIEEQRIEVVKGYSVDGLLIIPVAIGGKDEVFQKLVEEKWPFILIDKDMPEIDAPFIMTDDVAGSRMLMEHLISLGHRRIGFISGPRDATSAIARRQGYIEALETHELPVDEELITGSLWSEGEGERSAARLLRLNPRPTALFASTDPAAWGAYRAVREAGLNIPTDVSVAGYADLEPSAMISPPLTTIRQPAETIGRRAARMLLDIIEKKDEKPEKTKIPVELIVRGSTAARK